MLIDLSYFYGPLLEIPQVKEANVQADLTRHIAVYEPEFLTKLLGWQFYQDLKAGLLEDPIKNIWLNLLNGVGGVPGIVPSVLSNVSLNFYWPEDINVTVGDGSQYDPGVNGLAYHNPFLTGKTYRWSRRGFGQMKKDEYNQLDDGFSLKGDDRFADGEVLTIQFTNAVPLPAAQVTSGGGFKISPIANYVYFRYMNKQASFSTGSGEKVINQNNAVAASQRFKVTRAWNQMVDWNRAIIKSIRTNGLYPGFVYSNIDVDVLDYVNALNI